MVQWTITLTADDSAIGDEAVRIASDVLDGVLNDLRFFTETMVKQECGLRVQIEKGGD